MVDLTEKKYGRWTVLGFNRLERPNGTYRYYWNCRCECGNERPVLANTLKNGSSKSCGCLAKEKHPSKHGFSNTRLFSIWHSMIERCSNKNNIAYKNYGERGIKVCEEWKDNRNFFEWALKNGYEEGLTIDRIEVDGNYEPNNCRWVDRITQGNNTRRNRHVIVNGEKHTVAEWSRLNNIPYKLIYARVTKLGWDFEKAVTTPVRNSKLVERGV